MSRRDTPEVRQGRGSAAPVPGKCGGKLALTDPPRYCTQRPRKGRKRCKFHNGNARTGPDHANFIDGRTSKYGYLNEKVFVAFHAAMRDQQLMDLTPDIALLEVLKQDAAAGLGVGVTLERWKQAKDAFLELDRARTKDQVSGAMGKLRVALLSGVDLAAARDEVAKLIERRTKAVKVHQQLLIDSEELIPAKRVGLVMSLLATLVREFIEDDGRRREFTGRFIGLLGPRLRPGGQPAVVDAEPVPGR